MAGPSAVVTVNGTSIPITGTSGINVSAASTITIALVSNAGVNSWDINCTQTEGTNPNSTVALIQATKVVNQALFTATFVVPAFNNIGGGSPPVVWNEGASMQFQSIVNAGQFNQNIFTFGVFVIGSSTLRLVFNGENLETNATYGVAPDINAFLIGRALGPAGLDGGGDLRGLYPDPYVYSITGWPNNGPGVPSNAIVNVYASLFDFKIGAADAGFENDQGKIFLQPQNGFYEFFGSHLDILPTANNITINSLGAYTPTAAGFVFQTANAVAGNNNGGNFTINTGAGTGSGTAGEILLNINGTNAATAFNAGGAVFSVSNQLEVAGITTLSGTLNANAQNNLNGHVVFGAWIEYLTGNYPEFLRENLVLSSDANYTLANTEYNHYIIDVTSSVTLTATRNLVLPFPLSSSYGITWLIYNNTTTSNQQPIQVIGSSGTGVNIPVGQSSIVWTDGVNFYSSSQPLGNAAGDLFGTYPNPKVGGLRGIPIENQTLGAAQDGYVLTFSFANDWWFAAPPSGGGGGGSVTWANDLVGSTSLHQWVASISGQSGSGGVVPLNITTLQFASGQSSPALNQVAQSSTSGTGAAGQGLTISAQTGQASTGAGNNGGTGGGLTLNAGAGGAGGGGGGSQGTGGNVTINSGIGALGSPSGGNISLIAGGSAGQSSAQIVLQMGSGSPSLISIQTGSSSNELLTINNNGNFTWDSGTISVPTFSQTARASISSGSGANGTAFTVTAQAGQAATGASNNGGVGGAVAINGGAGGTSGSANGGNGGAITLTGGLGIATGGVGGVVSLVGGQGPAGGNVGLTGGAGTNGAGGTIAIAAGNAGTAGTGGGITVTSGTGAGGGGGGSIAILGGPGNGAGAGATVSITSGTGGGGGTNGGNGGALTVQAGAGGNGSSLGGNGGQLNLSSGAYGTGGVATGSAAISLQLGTTELISISGQTVGNVTFTNPLAVPTYSQTARASTSGGTGAVGNAWTIQAQGGQQATGASNNGGVGGALNLQAGAGGPSGSANGGVGGAVNITSGNGNGSGSGAVAGAVNITGGVGTGGGAVNLTGGNAGATGNGNGGSITLTPGTGHGTGTLGTINLAGSQNVVVSSAKTANYTIAKGDYFIRIGTLTSSITITLPASPSTGDRYEIKNGANQQYVIGNGTGTETVEGWIVTVTPNSGNIDGQASYVMDQPYQHITVTYNGSEWSIS